MVPDKTSRAMAGLGCAVIIAAPLAAVALSCAPSGSLPGSGTSVRPTRAPAVHQPTRPPHSEAQRSARPAAPKSTRR